MNAPSAGRRRRRSGPPQPTRTTTPRPPAPRGPLAGPASPHEQWCVGIGKPPCGFGAASPTVDRGRRWPPSARRAASPAPLLTRPGPDGPGRIRVGTAIPPRTGVKDFFRRKFNTKGNVTCWKHRVSVWVSSAASLSQLADSATLAALAVRFGWCALGDDAIEVRDPPQAVLPTVTHSKRFLQIAHASDYSRSTQRSTMIWRRNSRVRQLTALIDCQPLRP